MRPIAMMYTTAAAGRRLAFLRIRTYVGLVRLWRWRRRMARTASTIEDLVYALDQSPKLRRAVRLALRVKGVPADASGEQ